jgi:hypothetical protein
MKGTFLSIINSLSVVREVRHGKVITQVVLSDHLKSDNGFNVEPPASKAVADNLAVSHEQFGQLAGDLTADSAECTFREEKAIRLFLIVLDFLQSFRYYYRHLRCGYNHHAGNVLEEEVRGRQGRRGPLSCLRSGASRGVLLFDGPRTIGLDWLARGA